MQVKKAEVKEKIYNAAFEEFYNNSFKKSTMNSISKNSGVPVGNIYRYYVNKEAIFKDIVDNVSIQLFDLFSNLPPVKDENSDEIFKVIVMDFIEKLLELFFKNRKKINILMNKSEGSKYENFKTRLEENFIENVISATKLKFGDKVLSHEDIELVKVSATVFFKGLESIMTTFSEDDEFTKNLMFRYTDFFITDIIKRLKLGEK